jgi:glycosyltransferase involved in cell wall biosynthesis
LDTHLKICWISDFDSAGSGYLNITVPLCAGLTKKGHEVKVVGLQYKGEEHPFEFSVIPANNIQEAFAIGRNLFGMWKFDTMMVALDIPLQMGLLRSMINRTFPYIGIMPVEADPLCVTWAMALMQMSKPLIISEFGTAEARKLGVDADPIQIGIDIKSWRMPSSQEKTEIRKAQGIDEDAFVILTVADNQERKNLSAAMEIVAKFAKGKKVKYILVTREFSSVGWKLRDYAQVLGINDFFTIFERGLTFANLWSLYAISDLFLLTSKAEGLGMPILEAQAVGVPVAGTDCTAIAELLADNRGILLPYAYKYIDPFGNEHRYFVNVGKAVKLLNHAYENKEELQILSDNSRKYAEDRTWDKSVLCLEKALEYVNNEQKPKQEPTK